MIKILNLLLILGLFSGIAYIGNRTLHSHLFEVKEVEISGGDQARNLRLGAALKAVYQGKNLVEVSLDDLSAELSADPWVRGVSLTKRFPSTLSVHVTLRDPVALVQQDKAKNLQYVDTNGQIFGQVSPDFTKKLPVISGIWEGDRLPPQLVRFLRSWKKRSGQGFPKILLSSLDWNPREGLRTVLVYQFIGKSEKGRTVVYWGQGFDSVLGDLIAQLEGVLRYLSSHSIDAQRVTVDSSQKWVVKTYRRS